MIDASILILAKNEAANIGNCLASVYSQSYAGKIEVILVDSGSTDNTLEIAARFSPRIERIPPETFHHARTRNYAARLAQGKILVYLAADATPATTTWLDALIGNFEDPLVGAVYGKHMPKVGTSREREDTLGAIYGDQRLVKDETTKKTLGYRFYLMSTVNAALRRSLWETIPFPEHLKVFEDIGIAKLILDNGRRIVYEPKAVVYHSHDHKTVALLKRYFDLGFTFQYLGLWNSETRSSMLHDFMRLVRRKFDHTRPKTQPHQQNSRMQIDRELAKSIGFFLGLNERYLPRALKRRLSAFRVFG